MSVPEVMADPPSALSIASAYVFINHCGVDMKRKFANHLYWALKVQGISAFLDDEEFRDGDDVRRYLPEAVRRAPIQVPIFSKAYAESPWCLDELADMMDCWEKRQCKVLPVFYDVEPKDLREEDGLFAEQLNAHRKRGEEEITRWKHALAKASHLDGYLPDKYGGGEGELVANLVKRILTEISDSLSVEALSTGAGLNDEIQIVVQ